MSLPLFEEGEANKASNPSGTPLAERMRPRNLSEYIGQTHLLAPGRLLRRAIEADRVSSLILYGPPGTGKTTLARVIAEHSHATFVALNAVLSGVKILREEVHAAQNRKARFGQKTILFIDEIHRFNQSQQDALLPWVERGVVTLIGATTENPYFEVNAALNSRSHIFQLKPLQPSELNQVAEQALKDPRGYHHLKISLHADALAHWVSVVNGDARSLLKALELAVETTPANQAGVIDITLDIAEASIQERAVLYDRDGDAHFDTFSAFIKSMRGSDPDAALYWLAKMLYAGEPPRGIMRRLLIFASEDVGLAWPIGISVVEGCAAAFDRVGMPEGRFHLAQATLAMATAPKSNSTMGLFDALAAVERAPKGDVPLHLRDGSRDGEKFGHGVNYLYPHAYQNHWVAQEYLPAELKERMFYTPSNQGEEAAIGVRTRALREAQVEGTVIGGSLDPLIEQIDAVTPYQQQVEQWVIRAMGDVSQELAQLRDTLMAEAGLLRGDIVLDLNAGTGLLTWPSIRTCVEGGVYSLCESAERADTMNALSRGLPWVHRPTIIWGDLSQGIDMLSQLPELREVKFDHVIGRQILSRPVPSLSDLQTLFSLVDHQGQITLAEPEHQRASYLSRQLLSHLEHHDFGLKLDSSLLDCWLDAEEMAYRSISPKIDMESMAELLDQYISERVKEHERCTLHTSVMTCHRTLRITPAMVKRWCNPEPKRYLGRLKEAGLNTEEINEIGILMHGFVHQQISWQSSWRIIRLHISRR